MKAFYGGTVQASLINSLETDILKCVKAIISDLREHFVSITNEELEAGTFAVLRRLHDLGAAHPNVYATAHNDNVQAFQAGCNKIISMRRSAEDKKEFEGIPHKNDEKAQAILSVWEELKEKLGAVKAYKELLQMDSEFLNMGGYGYFLVSYRIPMNEGIYNNDEVIDAHNAHPILHDRNKVLGNIKL